MQLIEFLCRCPDNMDADEWNKIQAVDAEEAAKEFRSWYDSYCASWPSESMVIVRDPSGKETAFAVTLESCPVYTARETENSELT